MFLSATPVAAIIASLLATSATAPTTQPDPRIVIVRSPPTVRRIVFDRRHPPPQLPKFDAKESAGTVFRSDCRVRITHRLVQQTQRDGDIEVTIAPQTVRVELALQDIIYLPSDVQLGLRTHEEGHCAINERVYDAMAAAIATEAAREVLARNWSARGHDAAAAADAAADAAVQYVADEYRRQVLGRMSRAGEQYDRLTEHGQGSIAVTAAIEQAIQRSASEKP